MKKKHKKKKPIQNNLVAKYAYAAGNRCVVFVDKKKKNKNKRVKKVDVEIE